MHSVHIKTFLCDQNLGRLAKWLRIMGFDTLYMSCWSEESIQQALDSGRIVLTRKGKMAGKVGFVFIRDDRLEDQLKQLARIFDLEQEAQPFILCSICNCLLTEIGRGEVKGHVPEYVYMTHATFMVCPCCQRIYWKGTHIVRVEDILKHVLR